MPLVRQVISHLFCMWQFMMAIDFFLFGENMNITVYLGASFGSNPAYKKAAEEFGAWIGDNGHSLIYGGSKVGLMGAVAKSALDHGAHVTGVEPHFFIDQDLQLEEVSDLIVTENMQQRKALMLQKGDAYVALPGGTGTLEEISEIMSLCSLHRLHKPCFILNLDGYYDPLRTLLDEMIEKGFSTPSRLSEIQFVSSVAELKKTLAHVLKKSS